MRDNTFLGLRRDIDIGSGLIPYSLQDVAQGGVVRGDRQYAVVVSDGRRTGRQFFEDDM